MLLVSGSITEHFCSSKLAWPRVDIGILLDATVSVTPADCACLMYVILV